MNAPMLQMQVQVEADADADAVELAELPADSAANCIGGCGARRGVSTARRPNARHGWRLRQRS